MRRHRRAWVLCGMLCLLLAGIGGGAAVMARAAHAQPSGRSGIVRSSSIGSPSCYRWAATAGPGVASVYNTLDAVGEVPGSHQLWAVGQYLDANTQLHQTLIEHYDGKSWSMIPSPNVSSADNYLLGVTAISASDVWAVGYSESSSAGFMRALIERWNGTSWGIVSSSSPNPNSYALNAVMSLSASNVWAVGYFSDTTRYLNSTLIEHWNGSNWTVIASPNGSIVRQSSISGLRPYSGLQGQNELYGVSALSANDIWAVGTDGFGTVTEHWNGSVWSLISSPDDTNHVDHLYSVAFVSSSDVMAVGVAYATDGSGGQLLAEQWNGTSWSMVPISELGTTASDALTSVAAVPGTNHFIAVGTAATSNVGAPQTLMEQWNGASWSITATPNLGAYSNTLNSIVAGSATDVVAVGAFDSSASNPAQPLIERYVPNAMGVIC